VQFTFQCTSTFTVRNNSRILSLLEIGKNTLHSFFYIRLVSRLRVSVRLVACLQQLEDLLTPYSLPYASQFSHPVGVELQEADAVELRGGGSAHVRGNVRNAEAAHEGWEVSRA